MIYGYAIREVSEFKMPSQLEIMQEYYENEISFLNDIIKYQNESKLITESTELEALQEASIENIKAKIMKIVNDFIEFLKKIGRLIREKFNEFKKKSTDILSKVKKKINDIDKEDISESEKEIKKQQVVKLLVQGASDVDPALKDSVDKARAAGVPEKRIMKNMEDINRYFGSGSPKDRSDEKKEIEVPKKKYRYINGYLDHTTIHLTQFDNIERITEYIEYGLDKISDKKIDFLKRKLEMINFLSVEKYWEDLMKKNTKEKTLSAEEVITVYENNKKNYEEYQNTINKMNNEHEKFINKLKNYIANFNDSNASEYASVISKLVSVLKQYTQINVQIAILYGQNLKPVEIE